MKTIVSSLTALAVFGSSLMASSIATAEMSYNVGYVSEYYYRGFFQKNSSASAGADYESGGFFAGVWSAVVGDGGAVVPLVQQILRVPGSRVPGPVDSLYPFGPHPGFPPEGTPDPDPDFSCSSGPQLLPIPHATF